MYEALLRIYTESIPASERKTAEQLAVMVERPEYSFLAALESGTVAGFSITASLRGTEAALLEYMAVAPHQRDRGIGAWLFRATIAQPQLVGKFLLVEVDSDHTDLPDNVERTRRKAFYRRLGAKEIDGLRYRMPRVSSATPPPMELLVFREKLPAFIEKIYVRSWLQGCYAQVYGMPTESLQIEAMLESLPEQVPLI
jgi:GNAT superfamily N-acetyltransferase